jgi:hypothetical protein
MSGVCIAAPLSSSRHQYVMLVPKWGVLCVVCMDGVKGWEGWEGERNDERGGSISM